MTQTRNRGLTETITPSRHAIVEVHCAGRKIGLYRVRDVGSRTMVLGHGGISFPVGTELLIADFQKLTRDPRGTLPAKVVRNDTRGISIAW